MNIEVKGGLSNIFLKSSDIVSLDENGWVQRFEYGIYAVRESRKQQVIGSAVAIRMNCEGKYESAWWGRLANELVEEADGIDQDVYELSEMFYGNRCVVDDLGEPLSHADLLYIKAVHLKPSWRGYGIGLEVAETLIARHGQSAAIALIPSPIETLPRVSVTHAREKLGTYWKQLGLVPLPGRERVLWHDSVLKRTPYRSQQVVS